MDPLSITEDAVLRPYTAADATELTAVVAANREHLARWMPWADPHGYEDSVDYVTRKVEPRDDDGFDGAIDVGGRIVGGAAFHRIDRVNHTTSIGYWLAAEAQGRGLASATVRAMLDRAFGEWGLHRVVIEVIVGNERSRAVPERLGFTQEAILREAKLLHGSYRDTYLYAMLAPDWSSSPPREAIGSA